ncbi:sensor histidine kinase [Paenibacillus arenosi]|uniref:histidine kinase n=1 Tax=Paenibacillus arenosi TaxID=2774142 RepID=A0ABR9B3A9_9BACL|nr:HAMP domain-containing sensor histidine kinase [Paenibacillus arenosi]MBD8500859.1 HAMP domain-containing histidine kinase [Paenibacillus arenosi]
MVILLSLYALTTTLLLVGIIIRYRHVCKQLRKITHTLFRIRTANDHQRVRVQTSVQLLHQLSDELNQFLRHHKQLGERTLFLEEERNQMLMHLSHDLRTPLTSLLGYIEVIQRNAVGLSAEDKDSYLDVIHAKAVKLITQINDFFELAKLDSMESPLTLAPFDIVPVVQEVILSLHQPIELSQIEPILRLPNHPVLVYGNALGTERILLNLITNAYRYGVEGQFLGIEIQASTNEVVVQVSDKGKGISIADSPYIFNRFYTGQRSRGHHVQGSGLGLAIAKKLAEKQNGSLTFTSVPFENTTFFLTLPAHP